MDLNDINNWKDMYYNEMEKNKICELIIEALKEEVIENIMSIEKLEKANREYIKQNNKIQNNILRFDEERNIHSFNNIENIENIEKDNFEHKDNYNILEENRLEYNEHIIEEIRKDHVVIAANHFFQKLLISENRLKEAREEYDELEEDYNDTREKMLEYLEMTSEMPSEFEKKVRDKDEDLTRIIEKHNSLVGKYNELQRDHITLVEQYNSIILSRRGVEINVNLYRQ